MPAKAGTAAARSGSSMRWKYLRRRLSVSAPRVAIRRQLPWPVRWAFAAVVFGFSAAIALWAFEFGRSIAGLDRDATAEVASLREEVERSRRDGDKARAIADTSESLLKAERTALEKLSQQVHQLEAENLALKADLGFFERLLPANGNEGLAIRGLQVDSIAPTTLRYQMLAMLGGAVKSEFNGRYELSLIGTLAGKTWTLPVEAKPLHIRQYARVEGTVELPPDAVVKSVQVKISDATGAVRASQSVRL